MFTFRRAIRLFFGLVGFFLGAAVAAGAYLARTMIAPARQTFSRTPADLGLDFENAQFPAQDGVRLSGWFIPANADSNNSGETIVLLHGWQWNRLGYEAGDLFANLTGNVSVSLTPLIQALQAKEFNVLTLDLRNHGLSAACRPVTFGQTEAKDVLGALAYLEGREDVDSQKIGVVGFSIGANAGLFALPQTNSICALLAVQPMTPSTFTRRLSGDIFGPFGEPVRMFAEIFYRIVGGPRIRGIVPSFAAAGATTTPVMFVQGVGDRWGSVEDVSSIAKLTPCAQELLVVSSTHRSDGYKYLIDNPEVATGYFRQFMRN